MSLDESEALRAYARMLNTLDVSPLEALLAEDFTYEAQTVFSAITSKAEYLDYMRGKLETIRESDAPVFAEMGIVTAYGRTQPCVVVAQNTREHLVGLVLAKVEGPHLKRLDFCIIPPPDQAIRSGEYPT